MGKISTLVRISTVERNELSFKLEEADKIYTRGAGRGGTGERTCG